MKKILIINANYYDIITKKLVAASINFLKNTKFNLIILNVPGVFEIPIAIRKNINNFDAFLALGCVIKGKTPHFNLICRSTFNKILTLSINYNKPIGNGIITALNLHQAKERCGLIKSKKPNKGVEASKAVFSILQNGPKKFKNSSVRIKVIQKIYNSLMNSNAEIEYPRNQYKKFIKDVVTGTLGDLI